MTAQDEYYTASVYTKIRWYYKIARMNSTSKYQIVKDTMWLVIRDEACAKYSPKYKIYMQNVLAKIVTESMSDCYYTFNLIVD